MKSAIDSKVTTMLDVKNQNSYSRMKSAGMMITTEIDRHPYLQIEGKSYVTLKEMPIIMDDDIWVDVMGRNVTLFGGTEIDADQSRIDTVFMNIRECDQDWDDVQQRMPGLVTVAGGQDILLPFVVNDIDLPPMRILVPYKSIMKLTQQIEPASGVNARGRHAELKTANVCGHQQFISGTGIAGNCRSCIRRYWTRAAMERGIINGK